MAAAVNGTISIAMPSCNNLRPSTCRGCRGRKKEIICKRLGKQRGEVPSVKLQTMDCRRYSSRKLYLGMQIELLNKFVTDNQLRMTDNIMKRVAILFANDSLENYQTLKSLPY